MNRFRWAATAFAPCLAWSAAASAQTLPLGGRTASMGGAAAAWGRDSAMSYVNPAGFARVPHATLSLSASLYRYERVEVSDFFYQGTVDPALGALAGTPSAARNELVSSQFAAFPGAATLLWHFGPEGDPDAVHHVINLSAVVPRHRQRSFEGDFALVFPGNTTLRSSLTSTIRTTEYEFGPGYAVKLGAVKLGASLFATYFTSTVTDSGSVLTSRPDGFISLETSSYAEASALGLQAVFGIQVDPLPELALGAAVALPSTPITGDFAAQGSSRFTVPPDVADSSFVQAQRAEGETKRTYPLRIRTGIGYEQRKRWSFGLDAEVELAQDRAFEQDAEVTTAAQEQGLPVEVTRARSRAVGNTDAAVNLHLGVEGFLNDLIALRGGVFYEPSPTRLSPEAADVLVIDVDRVGFTTGVGFESDLGETTIGFEFSTGTGKTATGDVFTRAGETRHVLVDAALYSAAIFVSGAVDLEELEVVGRVIRDPEEAFGGKKRFVRLADLGPLLSPFEGDPDVDVLARAGIAHFETGDADVDAFLASVARLRAAIVTARALADRLIVEIAQQRQALAAAGIEPSAVLRSLWQQAQPAAPAGVAPPAPAPPLAEHAAKLIRVSLAMKQLLERLATDVGELPRQGAELMKSAGDKFDGARAALLPAVLRGIGQAQADAAASIRDLSALARSLAATLDELGAPEVSVAPPPAPYLPPASPPGPAPFDAPSAPTPGDP